MAQRRSVEIEFAPVRERFAVKHRITQQEQPAAVIKRLVKLSTARSVDPTLLTMATSSVCQEFLGVNGGTWRYWLSTKADHTLGPFPDPRDPGGPKRGRGVEDLWMLELDVVPWLLSSVAGTNRLVGVIQDIQAGKVRPVYRQGSPRAIAEFVAADA